MLPLRASSSRRDEAGARGGPIRALCLRHLGRLRRAAGRACPSREAEEAEQARAVPGAGLAGASLGNSGPPPGAAPGAPVAEVLEDVWLSPDKLAYVVCVVGAAS